MQLYLPRHLLDQIVQHARKDYPREACGLLIGSCLYDARFVMQLAVSANLAADPLRQFEIDSALHLKLQADLRSSDRAIIGLYHSHPDGQAAPSPSDLAGAWIENFVWLIVGSSAEGPVQSGAFYRGVEQKFRAMEIIQMETAA